MIFLGGVRLGWLTFSCPLFMWHVFDACSPRRDAMEKAPGDFNYCVRTNINRDKYPRWDDSQIVSRRSRGCTGKREQEGILTGEHHMNTEYVHSSSQVMGQNLRCATSCYCAFLTETNEWFGTLQMVKSFFLTYTRCCLIHTCSPCSLPATVIIYCFKHHLGLSQTWFLPPDHCLQSLPI